jgi:hypothetical protein
MNNNSTPQHHFFTRLGKLAMVHGLSVAGDAFLNVTLAGSAFLSVDISQARYRVAMSLLVTILPFALLASVISKTLQKVNKAQFVIIAFGLLSRAALFFAIANLYNGKTITNKNLVLSLVLALGVLIVSKTHYAVKNSSVAVVVNESHKFASANSRLTLVQAVAGGLGVAFASLFFAVFNAKVTLIVGACLYILDVFLVFRFGFITRGIKRKEKAQIVRKRGINDIDSKLYKQLKYFSSLIAISRFCIGLVTFACAFKFRNETMNLAIVGGSAVLVNFLSTVLVPFVMKRMKPQILIVLQIPIIVSGCLLAVFLGGVWAAVAVVICIAVGNSFARNGFDVFVQSLDDFDQSAYFTDIEGKLQFAWVLGALIGVLVPIPLRFTFLILGLVVGFSFLNLRNIHNPNLKV